MPNANRLFGVSADDGVGAPKEKTGLGAASVEGAVGATSGLFADGATVELSGGVLNENAGFVDVSEVASLLAAPKILIPGKGSLPTTFGVPKEKVGFDFSADPFTCPLATLPKGDETSVVEVIDALPKGDVDEPPNTEGLLTPPSGNDFGSFGVFSSFSSLLDGRAAPNIFGGCSVGFSPSPLGSDEPNKEPEGTLGGVNCTLVFAKKDGIAPSPIAGAGGAAEGGILDDGAAKGLKRASAGLGIGAGVLDTPKLKGNVAGAVLDPGDVEGT